MFKTHSLTGRISIWVWIGLLYGLLILVLAQLLDVSTINWLFAIWTVLVFVMLWFTIGFVGIFDKHPILGFKMKWRMLGIVGGTIFWLIYVLVWYDSIVIMMKSDFMVKYNLISPFWALIDYILAWLIIAFFQAKIAWEWSKLPLK